MDGIRTETRLYPDAKHANSLDVGAQFLDFVMIQLRDYGLYLQPMTSRKNQYEIGESLNGWEVKLDNRFTDTGRLSIEIAEKTRADNPVWIPSGIYRSDNTYLYIQGNYEYFYLFPKKYLVFLHETKRYQVDERHPTVKKFYLPIAHADKYCMLKVVPK